jgi:LacI family transcriptional regulator
MDRLPCVSVDRSDATAHAGFDLARAGNLVAEYLGQLGHRHFAVVTESGSLIGALLVAALQPHRDPTGAAPGVLNIDDGPLAESLMKRVASLHPPTALICSSDAIALAVIHACAGQGIDVPGRMSVVGFGDSALARCVTPMLTSVRIPAIGAGTAAAEYLLARFAGGVAESNELPVKLAVRASTGPPTPS